MKKFLMGIIIISLLVSCASFQEFSAQYDKVDKYLVDNGDYLDIDDLYSSWLLGEWEYNSKVFSVTTLEEILLDEIDSHLIITDCSKEANISVDDTSVSLGSFFDDNFSRKEEKGTNLINLIKVSDDRTKITMGKLEVDSEGEGEFLFIRTLSKVDSSIYFNVDFDSNGGAPVDDYTYQLGSKILKPDSVSRDGYLFKGWQLNESNFDFNTLCASNITLKAMWEEEVKQVEEVLVTFDSNGGSVIENELITLGTKVSEPDDPVRENYIFEGWLCDNKSYDFNQELEINITLTASWTPIVYEEEFLETRFFYSQCKDVQWNVSGDTINVSGPKMLYSAQISRQLNSNIFDDGAYIKFDETDTEGYYAQNLYSKDGVLLEVLSNKGTINYFGEYGFLYKADMNSNKASNTYCSYFYTKKALNEDGSTPNYASYNYITKVITDLEMLNDFN